MTCYIIDKKANNFGKTFSFAITITVATCDFLYIGVLSTSVFSIPCPLYLHLLCLGELSACLRLL